MPWVKFYTEILDDHKFGLLPDALKWRFVELCLLAGECDAEGYLANGDEAMSLEDIAWRLRRQPEELVSDLELLQQRGFISYEDDIWLIVNFAKRQGRRQSEKRQMWRERKQRQRLREAGLLQDTGQGHEPVTRDAPVIPSPREEKSREEKSSQPTAEQSDDEWLKTSRIVPLGDSEPPPDGIPADPLAHAVQAAQRKQPNWAVPPDAGGHDDFTDEPLAAFCHLVGVSPDTLPAKKRNGWAKELRGVAEEWGVGPPIVATCIQRIPDSEYHWKTYSSPYQDSFKEDLGTLIGQTLTEQKYGPQPKVVELRLR